MKSAYLSMGRPALLVLTLIVSVPLGLIACSATGPERSSTLRLSRPSVDQVVATASNEGLACSIPSAIDLAISANADETVVEQFRQACVQHDFCYRHGAPTYGVSRHLCDLDLYTHIKALCTQITRGGVSRAGCGVRAALTYLGVRLGGARSFRKNGYWHDYDAQPLAEGGVLSPRAIRLSSNGPHALAIVESGDSGRYSFHAWADGRIMPTFSMIAPAPGPHGADVFRHAELPHVVRTAEGERLAFTPSPRVLETAPDGTASRLGKSSLWVASLNPATRRFMGVPTGEDGYHVGEEDTQHMPALVEDFDGDGLVEAVYIGRSRAKGAASDCGGDNVNGEGSTYISVETVSTQGCYSVSVLDDVPGVSEPKREKYKKFQYPPIVGDFVEDRGSSVPQLEILLIYRPAQWVDLVTGWLLQQRPCESGKGICWQASVLSPEGYRLPAALHPLAAIPSVVGAPYGAQVQRLLGIDWTDVEPGVAQDSARVTIWEFGVTQTGARTFELSEPEVLTFPYRPTDGRSHSPITLLRHDEKLIGVYTELVPTKRGSSTRVATVWAGDDAVPRRVERSVYECQSDVQAASAQWVKWPLMLGDFDGDAVPDILLVDVADPEQSIMFSYQAGRFAPVGVRANGVCSR